MNFYITRTGMVHRGLGPNAFACNSGGGGRRRIYGRAISPEHAATQARFCRKCFPAGNPFTHTQGETS